MVSDMLRPSKPRFTLLNSTSGPLWIFALARDSHSALKKKTAGGFPERADEKINKFLSQSGTDQPCLALLLLNCKHGSQT